MKIIALIVVVAVHISLGEGLDPVSCSTHNEVVEVDAPLYRYVPVAVKLGRCRGGVGTKQPNVRRCVPSNQTYIDQTVFDVGGKRLVIKLNNHTKCTSECTQSEKDCTSLQKWNKEACLCQCRYQSEPSVGFCRRPFAWRQGKCGCVCTVPTNEQQCHENKIWSNTECDCRCKREYFDACAKQQRALDLRTCSCVVPVDGGIRNATSSARSGDSGGVSRGVLAAALIAELILLLIFQLLIYYLCCRRKERRDRPRFDLANHFTVNFRSKQSSKSKQTLKTTGAEFEYQDRETDSTIKKGSVIEDLSYDSAIHMNGRQDIMEVDGPRTPYLNNSANNSLTSSRAELKTDSELESTNDYWISRPATMV